jgi:hypothetical protein
MLQGLNKWFNKREAIDHPSPLDHGLGFTIRFAYPDDEVALRRLAAFDCQRPLTGRVLLAEVSGEIWAAINISGDRRAIADPFRHTAALISLLEQHAAGVPASRAHIPAREAGRPAALAAG